MAKKDIKEEPEVKKDDSTDVPTPEADPKKKVEAKLETAIDKGAAPQGAIDIVEAVPKPEDDASKSEWKAYFAKVDEKLDKLVKACVKDETPAPIDVPKKDWLTWW